MSNELKIGMIGLDTSHVGAFTKLLNDSSNEHHVPGGKVVIAFPGGSDMEKSYPRVEGYTNDLRQNYGVEMVDSPEAVAEKCDVILLESVDGRVHLEQFRKIAPFSKPTFIDKPFATSSQDAKEILELAKQYNTPIMSSSSLRYSEGLTNALRQTDHGTIIGADCYGPLEIEPTHGLFWYGIHTAEMLFSVLGQGCRKVTTIMNKDHDILVGEWMDGRIGTIRGNRQGNITFGALIHREKGTQFADVSLDSKPYYASLLEQIMNLFHTGKSPIALEESLEIIRFVEAANESRGTGKTVTL
jgi:hypothetical protein